MLREPLPDAIQLWPDGCGRYLWAMFDADIAPLLHAEERFRECGFTDLTREISRGKLTVSAGARYAQLLLHARRRCAFAESQ